MADPSTMSPAEARRAMHEILSNPRHAYWQPGDVEHGEAVRQMVKLHEMADPSAGKVLEAAGHVGGGFGTRSTFGLAAPSAPPQDPTDDAAARARVAAVVERLRKEGQTAQADALAAALAAPASEPTPFDPK
jgi:hypothetical protein